MIMLANLLGPDSRAMRSTESDEEEKGGADFLCKRQESVLFLFSMVWTLVWYPYITFALIFEKALVEQYCSNFLLSSISIAPYQASSRRLIKLFLFK